MSNFCLFFALLSRMFLDLWCRFRYFKRRAHA